ncbi:hypothetical protein GCM10023318_50910 [Nocardia callitridis]|uniref:Uncharacterized protein n=1 Tax=Nocardia callitridis TaxID=648753 RepID=A0ABP9KRY1_9NOCA
MHNGRSADSHAVTQLRPQYVTNAVGVVIFFGIPMVLLLITRTFTGNLGVGPERQVRRSNDGRYLIVPAHPAFAERFAAPPHARRSGQ